MYIVAYDITESALWYCTCTFIYIYIYLENGMLCFDVASANEVLKF